MNIKNITRNKFALYFSFEFLMMLVIVYGASIMFPISIKGACFVIFLFYAIWMYSYKHTSLLLQYYTHIIYVYLLFSILSYGVSVLTSHANVFYVSFISINIWCFLISFIRLVFIRTHIFNYRVLSHPDLVLSLTNSNKVKVVVSDDPEPNMYNKLDAIVVSKKVEYNHNWESLITYASVFDIPVIDITRYEELVENRLSIAQLQDSWVVAGLNIPIWYQFLKSLLERVLTILLIPILLPVFILVGIVIITTMGGPIFYCQYRIGLGNKPFKVYKFRSMLNNSDSAGETVDGDNRITKFGAFMRKFRVDELPQFINILKGDMSLIGPRPEWVETAEVFEKEIPLYRIRSMVKPGITGWAQVTQGHTIGEFGNYEKLKYDLYYVKHYGPILDIKIIIKTVYTVLTGFGAK
jgi:lipopolysaccharide/colanic/teichoic acid biosynthesis glycosyltransferase